MDKVLERDRPVGKAEISPEMARAGARRLADIFEMEYSAVAEIFAMQVFEVMMEACYPEPTL